MTKDELYDKLVAMLPVENKDDIDFRSLLSASFRTYQDYLDGVPEVSKDIKKEIAYICETLKEIVKAQYRGFHTQAFNKLSNPLSGKTNEQDFLSLILCKDNANVCNESLFSDCRMQLVLSNYKTSKKVDVKAV